MRKTLIHWVLSAVALVIVSKVVPGFIVSTPEAALIAALAIGFINATLGTLIKIMTLPLSIMTLGLFWFVINAAMIELVANLVPGFQVQTFVSAFMGAVVMCVVNLLLRIFIQPVAEEIL